MVSTFLICIVQDFFLILELFRALGLTFNYVGLYTFFSFFARLKRFHFKFYVITEFYEHTESTCQHYDVSNILFTFLLYFA